MGCNPIVGSIECFLVRRELRLRTATTHGKNENGYTSPTNIHPLVHLLLNLLDGALHLLLQLVHRAVDLRLVLVQERLQALLVDDSRQLQMKTRCQTHIHLGNEAADQQNHLHHVIQSVPRGDGYNTELQTGKEGHNRLHNVQESKHNPVDEPSTQKAHKNPTTWYHPSHHGTQ